jgi:hypothetical protein
MLNFSDSRSFGRSLSAISLVATPLILFLGALIGPDLGDNTGEELTKISDNEATYIIGGLLFLIAPLVLIPGMVGTIRLMRRRRVTLGQVGAALILIGGLSTIAFYGYGLVEYVAATESGLDHAQMAKLFDAAEDTALNVPFIVLFFIGLIVGSVLLGVALWRSRVVPIWSPIALVVSTVINFGGENKWIAVISFALLFVALLPIAQKILSISDDDWERWRLPEAERAQPPPAAPTGPPTGA